MLIKLKIMWELYLFTEFKNLERFPRYDSFQNGWGLFLGLFLGNILKTQD